MAKYEMHDFYCLKCGKAGLPVHRKIGKQYGEFHRKKLYCPWCKMEINHMEIRNDQEKAIFLENFNNGEYQQEAEESISTIKNTWIGQLNARV